MTNDHITLCDTIIIHRGNACNADRAAEGLVRAGAVNRHRGFSTFEKNNQAVFISGHNSSNQMGHDRKLVTKTVTTRHVHQQCTLNKFQALMISTCFPHSVTHFAQDSCCLS